MKNEYALVIGGIVVLFLIILFSTFTSWSYFGGGYPSYQMMPMMGGGMC